VSEPTRHHYIPIFYLKQWAGNDKRLFEYSRPYRVTKAKRKHPSATAYVDGLYTVPGVPLEHAQFVEKRFMQAVDDWAARALAIMLDPNSTSNDLDLRMKVAWARFLYSLIVRNPEHIARIQQKADEPSPERSENIRDQYPQLRGPNDPPTFDEFKALQMANPPKIPAQQMLPTLINSRLVITEIIAMQWTTVDLKDTRYSMLTSDRPVIMTNGLNRPCSHRHSAFPTVPVLCGKKR
jgi:hypothetical protein